MDKITVSTFGNHKVDPATIQQGDVVTIEVKASFWTMDRSGPVYGNSLVFIGDGNKPIDVKLDSCNIIAVRKPEPVMKRGDEIWWQSTNGFFNHAEVREWEGKGPSEAMPHPIMLIRGDRVIWRKEG